MENKEMNFSGKGILTVITGIIIMGSTIARAVARRPKVLIFDDSFSALDYNTDPTLSQRLNKKTQKTTLFIDTITK